MLSYTDCQTFPSNSEQTFCLRGLFEVYIRVLRKFWNNKFLFKTITKINFELSLQLLEDLALTNEFPVK